MKINKSVLHTITSELNPSFNNADIFSFDEKDHCFFISGTWDNGDHYSYHYYQEDAPQDKRIQSDDVKFNYVYDNSEYDRVKKVYDKCSKVHDI